MPDAEGGLFQKYFVMLHSLVDSAPEADGFRGFFVEIACCCETAKNNYLCSLNGLSINRIIV